MEVEVKLNGKTGKALLHVFKNGASLCGRNLIRILEMDCGPYYVKRVGTLNETTQTQLENILENHKEGACSARSLVAVK